MEQHFERKCPVCFFRNEHQKDLKDRCGEIACFEDKMERYKGLVVDGVQNLISISECECIEQYDHEGFIQWTDELKEEAKKVTHQIRDSFERLRESYLTYVSGRSRKAHDIFWEFMTENELVNGIESPTSLSRLFFRGRPKGDYDPDDKLELFHVPFSSREKLGSQRFNINGTPILYLGGSILNVKRELECSIRELNIAAFLPMYSCVYEDKVFYLKNYFTESVEKSAAQVFKAGANIDFQDSQVRPNADTMEQDILQAVLMHVCTFPRQSHGEFVPEYVIPNMLTSVLREHEYQGIIFPSTKSYRALSGHHRFSHHNVNLAFFTSYTDEDYDYNLLDKFITAPQSKVTNYTFTSEQVSEELDRWEELNVKTKHGNRDLVVPLPSMRAHIEYFSDAEIDGERYFDTRAGNMELGFYYYFSQAFNETIACQYGRDT